MASLIHTTSPDPMNPATVSALRLLSQYGYSRMTESDLLALLVWRGVRLSDLNRTPAELLQLRRAH